jgi:hypothetical protein
VDLEAEDRWAGRFSGRGRGAVDAVDAVAAEAAGGGALRLVAAGRDFLLVLAGGDVRARLVADGPGCFAVLGPG